VKIERFPQSQQECKTSSTRKLGVHLAGSAVVAAFLLGIYFGEGNRLRSRFTAMVEGF
jgi:hypothetical protein